MDVIISDNARTSSHKDHIANNRPSHIAYEEYSHVRYFTWHDKSTERIRRK